MANVLVIASIVLVGAALLTGKLTLVRVAGGSMVPALAPGDLCVVVPTSAPRRADIVLFAPPGHKGLVLHRVRERRRGLLVTQGDANEVEDRERVRPDAVIGRVAATLPIGRAVGWWQAAKIRW